MAGSPVVPQMDPQAMARMGFNNPFAPPEPPPPSPSLGFQTWASDPRNAHKVQPSMTAANAPLQPNAGQQPSAAANPPQRTSPLMPPQIPGQQQLTNDQTELQRLQQNGAGLNQIKNPLLRGLAKVGDIAAPFLVGRGAAAIPGTSAHNAYLQDRQAGRVQMDQEGMQTQLKQLLDQANLTRTGAETEHLQQETANLQNPEDKPDKFIVQSTDQGLIRINQSTGEATPITDPTGRPYGKTDKPGTVHETMSGMVMVSPDGKATPIMDPKTGKQLQGNLQKPPVINMPKQMVLVPQPDGSSKAMEVTPGSVVPAGATTIGANGKAGEKINADEQKRADMARNINENIDQLDEILTRRPDLFGPVAGRITGFKNAMGSDDPDVGKLMTIRHNLGMVGQSVHGMRSAQGVESQANALVNSFHNSPEATRAALQSMKQSAATFLNDESNRVGKVAGNPPAGNALTPPARAGIQALTDGGVTYHIPANMVAAFKKDHPNAR